MLRNSLSVSSKEILTTTTSEERSARSRERGRRREVGRVGYWMGKCSS